MSRLRVLLAESRFITASWLNDQQRTVYRVGDELSSSRAIGVTTNRRHRCTCGKRQSKGLIDGQLHLRTGILRAAAGGDCAGPAAGAGESGAGRAAGNSLAG